MDIEQNVDIKQNNETQDLAGVSLAGLYVISVVSMAIGVTIVLVLNLATPTDFILNRFADLKGETGFSYVLALFKRLPGLLLLILGVGAPSLLVMQRLLRPVSHCLRRMKEGREPEPLRVDQAGRRIINLPFIFMAINVGIWVFLPALIFFLSYLISMMDLRTAAVFSIRASMVGFITSSVAFYRIEAHCRKGLIPLFFPGGHLAEIKGAASLSIGRRIRLFYGMGTVLPLVVLMVTLVTVQWEMAPGAMSAKEYGMRIILFTMVLSGIFLMSAGVLNRLLIRSIVEPLENMLKVTDQIRQGEYASRIKVLGNDEIGVLGDSGNAMIRGLREREKLRSTFGQYVTPEIRDEILSGRIPLEGERREGTVMFADLENFTPFVENNPPEEAMRSMRAYFTCMQQAIRLHKGLILQFVGDEVEAVFGVPVYFEGHADAAVAAALEMRKALKVLNRERTARGKAMFAHGIGIHSGNVLAGNSGSEEQSAYSLMGNTVNVAARIQGLTRDIKCDILISHETVGQLTVSPKMEEQRPRRVKGYSKPITVYRVLQTQIYQTIRQIHENLGLKGGNVITLDRALDRSGIFAVVKRWCDTRIDG